MRGRKIDDNPCIEGLGISRCVYYWFFRGYISFASLYQNGQESAPQIDESVIEEPAATTEAEPETAEPESETAEEPAAEGPAEETTDEQAEPAESQEEAEAPAEENTIQEQE